MKKIIVTAIFAIAVLAGNGFAGEAEDELVKALAEQVRQENARKQADYEREQRDRQAQEEREKRERINACNAPCDDAYNDCVSSHLKGYNCWTPRDACKRNCQ